jgi:hypothetical protein
MRINLRSTAARAGVLALAGGIVAFTAGVAQAVTPGWTPDANAAGGLYFYDSSGHQITSGSINDSPMASYYVASGGAINAGNDRAFQAFSTPVQGANSATWPGTQGISSTQVFNPPAALPGDLNGYTGAVVHGVATDGSLNADQIAAFPNSSAVAGYQNLYEVRVYTAGGVNGQSSTWYSATIEVTGSTWAQVFPVQTSTTTGLSAPANVVSPGNATLSATVTPNTATGSVRFTEGATVLATVPVAGGTASTTVTSPALGGHSWTATYVPTPGSAFLGSSGNASTTVSAPATPTTTTMDPVTPLPASAGDTLTFTAHVTPAAAAGTVSFFDGATLVVTSAAGSGTFTATSNALGAGSHSLTATFNPTSPGTYNPSTSSPPQVFDLGAAVCSGTAATPGATTCTDVQSITATIGAGTLVVSTPYDAAHPLNIPLALNATATFFSGAANFHSIQVTDTRAGSLPWTLKAQATALANGASSIDSQNIGLTGLVPIGSPSVDVSAANFTVTDNAAASPPVAFGAPGTLGLGGGIQHTLAHAIHGQGAVALDGTLTINAPASLPAGTYTGTITFTTG